MNTLRFTGILVALMVVTMTFMPAVAAQSAANTNENFASAAEPRLIPP